MAKKRLTVEVVRVERWAIDVEVDEVQINDDLPWNDRPDISQLEVVVNDMDENHEPGGEWFSMGPGWGIKVIDASTGQDVSGDYQLSLPPWACE